MDNSTLANRWITLLKPIFPSDASLVMGNSNNIVNDIVIDIDWKLGNNPNRPNKRSRVIRLKITYEAVKDCKDLNKADEKLIKIVKMKLAQFNPDHNHPREKPPPVETWVITNEMI